MSTLQDLLEKLKSLEENTSQSEVEIKHHDNVDDEVEDKVDEAGEVVAPVADQGGAGASDESMDMEECPQDGNVQLSMSDLVKLIHHLQKGGPDVDKDATLLGDEYGNAQAGEPEAEVAPVAAVLPTGDDLASNGEEALKVNGGGNPMHHHLAELYAQIKEAAKKSDIPAAQRKAKGGDWKVTKQDLDAEEKEGKISHKDNLAKNNGTSLKEANEIARKLRRV